MSPRKSHPNTQRKVGTKAGYKRFCVDCVRVNAACPSTHLQIDFHVPKVRVPKETASKKVWVEFVYKALWYGQMDVSWITDSYSLEFHGKSKEALALALKNLGA